MDKKILFFDVDGTIVTADHIIPESAREALHAAQKAGHTLIVNTGRPYRHIESQILALGFDGYVCSVGGHIVYNGKSLVHHTIPHEEAVKIRDVGYECGMYMLFESETGVWMDEAVSAESKYLMIDYSWLVKIGVPSYQNTYRDDFTFDKFVCWPSPNGDPERFEAAFSDTLDFIHREHGMMEVVGKGLTKAGGMRTMMQMLGFAKEDSFAFGDGANDLPMLREAGTSVLMGNAPAYLHKEADYLTAPITEDGLAKALKHFNLI